MTLQEWLATLTPAKPDMKGKRTTTRMGNGEYWYIPDPPFRDFNREIVPPGEQKLFPDGAVGIRADGNFWSVAALPYEFKDTPIWDIVSVLWGGLEPPAFCRPDDGLDGFEHFLAMAEILMVREGVEIDSAKLRRIARDLRYEALHEAERAVSAVNVAYYRHGIQPRWTGKRAVDLCRSHIMRLTHYQPENDVDDFER